MTSTKITGGETITSLKDLKKLPMVDTPIYRDDPDGKFREPITAENLDKVLRMLLAEGRKRENHLLELRNEVTALHATVKTLCDVVSDLGDEVAYIREDVEAVFEKEPRAKQTPTRLKACIKGNQMADIVLDCMTLGEPTTSFNLLPHVNAKLHEMGVVESSIKAISKWLAVLHQEQRIARLQKSIYLRAAAPVGGGHE